MRKRLLTVLFTFVWLAALLGCLFCALRSTIRTPAYFSENYARIGIEAATGIKEDDCVRAVYRLVDYMEGKADSIQLEVTENGKTVEMYNQQEIDHMVDVRALYQGFRSFSLIALALFAAMLALCVWKKELGDLLMSSYRYALGIFLAVILVAGAWVLLDFNSFWMGFHRLFFRNDLWLMDPAVCRMIRICPLELFYGIVLRMGALFIAEIILLPLLVVLVKKLWNKRAAKRRENTV